MYVCIGFGLFEQLSHLRAFLWFLTCVVREVAESVQIGVKYICLDKFSSSLFRFEFRGENRASD